MLPKEFIDKYAGLVSDNICRSHNVDPNNKELCALLAYKLTTGSDFAKPIKSKTKASFDIDAAGIFLVDNTKVATCEDLIENPVLVAFNIIDKNTESTKGQYSFTVTFNNLMWLSELFQAMHITMRDNKHVPVIWKLCDYSYKDCNHVIPNIKFQNTVMLFAFVNGSITYKGPWSKNFDYNMKAGSTYLQTKQIDEVGGDCVVDSKDILKAYMIEHAMPYIIAE